MGALAYKYAVLAFNQVPPIGSRGFKGCALGQALHHGESLSARSTVAYWEKEGFEGEVLVIAASTTFFAGVLVLLLVVLMLLLALLPPCQVSPLLLL